MRETGSIFLISDDIYLVSSFSINRLRLSILRVLNIPSFVRTVAAIIMLFRLIMTPFDDKKIFDINYTAAFLSGSQFLFYILRLDFSTCKNIVDAF